MSLQAALLCDFAQVREGLLFVSSGGVARVNCPVRPAHLNLFLAAVVVIEPHEISLVHEVRVTVTRDGGATIIGQAVTGFQAPPPDQLVVFAGEPLVVPLVMPLHPVELTETGAHDVRVSLDGEAPTILTLYVSDAAPGTANPSPSDSS